MKKFLIILGCFLFLVGCTSEENRSSEVIRIGGITPLSGDASSYGQLVQNVTTLVVEDLNANGGINGRPLEILWEDGKCNPGDASRAAQKLIRIDKVSLITGFSCSGELLGVAPISEKEKVILMGPITSSPEISQAGDFVFRTFPSDSSQGRILAEEANKHFHNIGIFVEQSDYAIGIANVFTEHFKGEIQREEFLSSEADFKTRITKLKNSDIQSILLITQAPPKMDIILKQLQEQNWTLPLWGNEMLANDRDVIEKYATFLGSFDSVISAMFVPPETKSFQDFIEQYKVKYNENPKFMDYIGSIADAINVIAHVLRKGIDLSDTEAIRDALYNLDDFEGMHGQVSFDENGDVGMGHTLLRFDGETFSPISN